MSFIDKYLVKLSSRQIGEDQFGNKYYVGKSKNYTGRNKRYVIYKGIEDSSKIPPIWHAWLHYMQDDVPEKTESYDWEKGYLPNLTGTKFSYDPAKSDCKKIETYSKWQPK